MGLSKIEIEKHLVEHQIILQNMKLDFVPYVGAIFDVDLGVKTLTANTIISTEPLTTNVGMQIGEGGWLQIGSETATPTTSGISFGDWLASPTTSYVKLYTNNDRELTIKAANKILFETAGVNIGTYEDNIPLYFGAAEDSQIYYDGDNLVINPNKEGNGNVIITNGLECEGSITGKLRPSAGTTEAGTTPLKFTSGDLTTIPENGSVEYSNGVIYIRSDHVNFANNLLVGGSLGIDSINIGTDFSISKTGDVWAIDGENKDSDTNTLIIKTGAEEHLIAGLGSTGGTYEDMDIGAGGLVTIKGTLGAGATTVTSLTDSGLTSGRVVYTTTGGLLTDSSDLTFNGTTFDALASGGKFAHFGTTGDDTTYNFRFFSTPSYRSDRPRQIVYDIWSDGSVGIKSSMCLRLNRTSDIGDGDGPGFLFSYGTGGDVNGVNAITDHFIGRMSCVRWGTDGGTPPKYGGKLGFDVMNSAGTLASEFTVVTSDIRIPKDNSFLSFGAGTGVAYGNVGDVKIGYTGTYWDFDIAQTTTAIRFNQSQIDTDFIVYGDTGATLTLDAGTLGATFGGDIDVPSSNAFYFGGSTTDGSWRIIRNGDNLEIQRRESSAWVTKSTIEA